MRKFYSCFTIRILVGFFLLFKVTSLFSLDEKNSYAGELTFMDNRYSFLALQFRAVDDSARTGPVQQIIVEVTENDTITCSDYQLSIMDLPDPSEGSARLIGNDHIAFIPAAGFYGVVAIPYQITCSSSSVSEAVLYITVDRYNIPINVIPANTGCVDTMKQNIDFSGALKFAQEEVNINGFSMPLVGDLNGDGKPEIVALGLGDRAGTSCVIGYDCGNDLAGRGRYIVIYDGQNGNVLTKFDLRSELGYAEVSGDERQNQFELRFNPRHNSPCQMAIADLDNDGIGEIVVCETGNLGRVYALKPVLDDNGAITNNMTKMWDADVSSKYPLTRNSPGAILANNHEVMGAAMPYISDLNGDGIPEVIVYNKIYNGRTGKLLLELEELRYFRRADAGNTNYMFTEADLNARKPYAYVGRRHGWSSETDDATPVISIIDIDGDGKMEIVAGMKIYFPNIVDTSGPAGNSFRIVHGPDRVTIPLGPNSNMTTLYLMDGFTTVADIDGDGELEIIVQNNVDHNWDDDYRGLITVWNLSDTTAVKAATAFRGNSEGAMSSIPFIGDINGYYDDYSGTKKLPEICISTGVLYISRTADPRITGIPVHPNPAVSTGLANALSSGYFNRDDGTGMNESKGHVFGLTYHSNPDESTPLWERLKLSFAMEHTDISAQTGITMFDFDNDGRMDLCYRDQTHIRVISPSLSNGYIRKNVTEGPGSPIRFRWGNSGDNKLSFTGFEAPVIADINMDGSADIISACYNENAWRSWGFPYVFEHTEGTEKWAPAPPVWNQGIYFPLQINSDLTVPARPQSTLTPYLDRNNDTIRPYNGCWIQQPVVKEGEKYIPVVTYPDAAISEVTVNAVTNPATVTITVKNEGSAAMNARTPITLYRDSLGNPALLKTELGNDLFPGEKTTLTLNLPAGNYDEVLIWVRITDSLGIFPANGYIDCNLENNTFAGIDCPNMSVEIFATPANGSICGYEAAVMLEVVTDTAYANPEYQWYRNEQIIPGAVHPVYFAVRAGEYKVYVIDGNCRKFSEQTIPITWNSGNFPSPLLETIPDNVICSDDGSVYLWIANHTDYQNPVYHWFIDTVKFSITSQPYWVAQDAGQYHVFVEEENCGALSNGLFVDTIPIPMSAPTIAQEPPGQNLCGGNGRILLYINDTISPQNVTYQWFLDSLPIAGANQAWYIAGSPGEYSVQKREENRCAAFSNSIAVSLTEGNTVVPQLTRRPDTDTLCINGDISLSVNNGASYVNPVYIWYRDGREIQRGSSAVYTVNDTGNYFVMVEENGCSSISSVESIILSENSITTPEIASVNGEYSLCGPNSVVILNVTNPTDYDENSTYQWYRNGIPIPGSTGTEYSANTIGFYSVRVQEGSCSAVSDERELLNGSNPDYNRPRIEKDPFGGEICGVNSSVFLYVANANTYGPDAVFSWYRGDELKQQSSDITYKATEEGFYIVRVDENDCSAISNTVSVESSSTENIARPHIESLTGESVICGDTGVVLLRLINASDYAPDVFYRWYRDNELINSGNAQETYYLANMPGNYTLRIIDDSCSSVSNSIGISRNDGTITKPLLQRIPASGAICANGSVLLTIVNTDRYTDPVYLWLRNQDTLSHNESYLETTSPGSYRVLIYDLGCSAVSDPILLTASGSSIAEPVIESVVGNEAMCDTNGVILLRLQNEDQFTGASYLWFYNNIPVNNSNTALFHATDSGFYRIQVRENNCSAISSPFRVTLNNTAGLDKPLLASDPPNGTICGNNGRVKLWISNSDRFREAIYIWFHNNREIERDTLPQFYAEEEGVYFVAVFNGECFSESDTLTINGSGQSIITPILSSQPPSTTICRDSGAVVIRVDNYSSFYNPQYQWYKNDIAIPGATNPVLIAYNGGRYRIRIINGYGCSVYSDEITITEGRDTEYPRPVLAAFPNDGVIVGEDGEVTLSISNRSELGNPEEYIWYNTRGVVTTGDSILVISIPETYFVQILYADSCSSVSLPFEITSSDVVIPRPIINAYPDNESICGGDGLISISITNPSSYSTPSYHWYFNNIVIPGETGESLYAGQPGNYTLIVRDSIAGTAVNSPPSLPLFIEINPNEIEKPLLAASGNLICGSSGRILFHISNYGNYGNETTYNWYRNDLLIQSSFSPSYVADEAGIYYAEVMDGDCLSISESDTVEYNPTDITIPQVSSLGSTENLCGDSGTVILRVNNHSEFAGAVFQWHKNNIPIPNATDTLIRITNDSLGEGKYRIEVKSGECTAISQEIPVSFANALTEKPYLSKRPPEGGLCSGGSVQLYVTNTSDFSDAIYIWFRNYTEIVQQGTSSSYETGLPGIYTVFAISGTCSSESDTVAIRALPSSILPPSIESASGDTLVCNGENASILLRITNEQAYVNPQYQWYNRSEPIQDAYLPWYVANTNGNYRLQVTEGSCSAFSDAMIVNRGGNGIISKPQLIAYPDTDTLCSQNGKILLRVSNSGDYSPDSYYLWFNGNRKIKYSTEDFYYADTSGLYFVQLTDGACSAVSNEKKVELSGESIENPVISALPENSLLCGNNGTAVLRLENPEMFNNATFQWYKNNSPLPGTESILYKANETGEYRLEVNENGCSAFSDSIVLLFTPGNGLNRPQLEKIPASGELCGSGSNVLLHVTNSRQFQDRVEYVWYLDNRIAYRNTNPTFPAEVGGTYFVQVIDTTTLCSSVSDTVVITDSGIPIGVPVITSHPSQNTVCGNNGTVALVLENQSSWSDYHFQWYRNDNILNEATEPLYHVSDSGAYRLWVSDGTCSAFSNLIHVTSDEQETAVPIPLINVIPAGGGICNPEGMVIFEIENYSPDMLYILYNNAEYAGTFTTRQREIYEAGRYRIQAVDSRNCSSVSDTVRINGSSDSIVKPQINAYPDGNSLCGITGALVLTLDNPSAWTGYDLQWYDGDSLLPGATEALYIVRNTGNYRIFVTNGICSSFSDSLPLLPDTNLNPPEIPNLALDPSNGNLCGNNSVVMIEIRNFAPGLSYTWYKDTEPIPGNSTGRLTVNAPGRYFVQAVDSEGCSIVSDTVRISSGISPIGKPVITARPTASPVCGSTGVVVLVLNNQSQWQNFTFRWFDGDSLLEEADEALYLAYSSGHYRLLVSDGECAAFSNTLRIEHNESDSSLIPPTLNIIPPDGSLCGENSSVILEVLYPDSNLTYLWYRNTESMGQNGIRIEIHQPGKYFVQATDNRNCSSVSDTFRVKENPISTIEDPTIRSYPEQNVLCGTGGAIVLALEDQASWTGYTFQWYNGDMRIESAAEALWIAERPGYYRLFVTDGTCGAFSNSVTIEPAGEGTAIPNPVVSAVPTIPQLCGASSSVILSIDNFDSTFHYQWYYGTEAVADGNNATLEVNRPGRYFVQAVDSAFCSSLSDTINIPDSENIIVKPSISSFPEQNTICGNTGAVVLTLNDPDQWNGYQLQWYIGDTPIPQANEPLYRAREEGYFRILATDSHCSAFSDSIQISLNGNAEQPETPLIRSLPPNGELCGTGSSVILFIDNFDPTIHYQWYYGTEAVADGNNAALEVNRPGRYFVQAVDSAFCSSLSDTIVIIDSGENIEMPLISSDPSQVICGNNGVVILRLINEEDFPASSRFQWFKNDTLLPGEESPLFLAREQGIYRLRAIDNSCMIFSDSVIIGSDDTFIPVPVTETLPSGGIICGDSGLVEIRIQNHFQYISPHYIWYKDSIIVQDSTIPFLITPDEGIYFVRVNDGNCSAISYADTLERGLLPQAIFESSQTTICEGDSIVLEVSLSSAPDAIFDWQFSYSDGNNIFEINHITSQRYFWTVYPSGTGSREYTLVEVTDHTTGCTNTVDSSIYMSIYTAPSVSAAIDTLAMPTGENDTVFLTLSGTAPWTIYYTLDGSPDSITGITSSLYGIPVSYTTAGRHIYRFTGITDLHCSSQPDMEVIILVYDSTGITVFLTGDTVICTGDSAELSLEIHGGIPPWSVSFLKGITDSTISNIGQSPYRFLVSPATSTTYSLRKVTDGNGQSVDISGQVSVRVNTRPSAFILSDSVTIDSNTIHSIPIEYMANNGATVYYSRTNGNDSVTGSFTLPASTEGMAVYNWPVITPSEIGTYHYRLTHVDDSTGCRGITGGNYTITVFYCIPQGLFSMECPRDTLATLPYGKCDTVITLRTPPVIHWLDTIPGIDPEISIHHDAPPGFSFGAGVHYIHWTATDRCGTSVSCEQTVSINPMPCGMNDTIRNADGSVDSVISVTATDFEGHEYGTARIGCDCWMTENLKSAIYSDGSPIPDTHIYYTEEFSDSLQNLTTYGRLYSWYAAARQPRIFRSSGIRGACPEGWELPGISQYERLLSYGSDALRAVNGHWINDTTSTNNTRFSALPAGFYNSSDAKFYHLFGDAYFWTGDATSETMAAGFHIRYNCPEPFIDNFNKRNGFSVRCVKINP